MEEKRKIINMLDDPKYQNLLDRQSNDESAIVHSSKRRCCSRCCSSSGCKWLLIFLIVTCIGLGVTFYLTTYIEDTIQGIVVSQLPLAEGSQRALDWSKGQPPLSYRIYIFNLTNPKEFLNGDRPRLLEVGPFVYEVIESKEEAMFNGSTVTFRSKPVFLFQKDLSVEGGEDVEIFTLNVPLVNAGELTRGPALGTAFSLIREAYSFDSVKQLSARELLWGHKSRVLDFAKQLKDLPYPYDYFALLAGRNNTLQPLTTINTGVDDVSKMSEFLSYDGPGPRAGCNGYRGTDGSAFGPNINKSRVLFIYNGQFCRSLPLVYHKTVQNQGLTAYRFVLPEDVFTYSETFSQQNQSQSISRNFNMLYGNTRFGHYDNVLVSKSTSNSENIPSWKDVYGGSNKCFCNKNRCPPDGVLDMKACLYGAAVGFTFPHLMNADPALRHIVQGMRPDPTKHNTEFDILPGLGIPVRVKLRMQMNIVLDNNQALDRDRDFDLIYPVFWFEAGIDALPANLAGKLQMAQNIPFFANTLIVVLFGVVAVVLLIVLLLVTVFSCQDSDHCSQRSLMITHHTTRPTTPDYEGSQLKSSDKDGLASDQEERLLHHGTYTSFQRPHSIANSDTPILITDHHTLLPPYKIARAESRAPNLFCDGDSSLGGAGLDCPREVTPNDLKPAHANYDKHRIDEVCNEYPPCYEVAAQQAVFPSSSSPFSSSPVSVAADVHHSASYIDVRIDGNNSLILTVTDEIVPPALQPSDDVPFESSIEEPDICPTIDQNPVIAFDAPKVISETLKRRKKSCSSEIPPVGMNLLKSSFVDDAEENDRNNQIPLATSSPHQANQGIQTSLLRKQEDNQSQSPVEPSELSGSQPSFSSGEGNSQSPAEQSFPRERQPSLSSGEDNSQSPAEQSFPRERQPSFSSGEDNSQSPAETSKSRRQRFPNPAADTCSDNKVLQRKDNSSDAVSESEQESPGRVAPLESDL